MTIIQSYLIKGISVLLMLLVRQLFLFFSKGVRNVDDEKYFVVKIKGNNEYILAEFEDEDSAKEKMNNIGRRNKVGVIAVAKGKRYNENELDYRSKEIVAVYDKWLDRVLKSNF